MRFFISYTQEDTEVVRQLVAVLGYAGHDAWFDQHLLSEHDWKAELKQAIAQCDAYIYALTSASVASEWCQWEFATAIELKKRVIPILLERGTTLPKLLQRHHWAGLTQQPTAQTIAKLRDVNEIAVTIPPGDAPQAPSNPKGVPVEAHHQRRSVVREQPRRLKLATIIGLILIGLTIAEIAQSFLPYVTNVSDDRTVADYTRSIELDPHDVNAYMNRGIAYFNQGEYELAIADYTLVIELDPDNAPAFNNRGAAYSAQGKYDEAVADFTGAIELAPDYTDAYFNRGNAYWFVGEYAQSIADFNIVLEHSPDNADAYYNRGNAYAQQDDKDRAVADYTRAIQLNPNDVAAYHNRGTIYAEQGEHTLAIADFEHAIELDPDGANPYMGLGLLYGTTGDFERALVNLREYVRLAGQSADPRATDLIAHIEADLGTSTP